MPAKKIEGFTLTPESSFYKSVRYINNVLGPVKDIIYGVENEDDHNNQYMKSCEYVGYRAGKVYLLCQLAASWRLHNIAAFTFDSGIFVVLSTQVIFKDNREQLFKSKYRVIGRPSKRIFRYWTGMR
ncbi:hypothetical protein [Wolbachia endosymbiont of Mansonella perstans]|uniref:hypothetical protein n=1 Tax=Wolbachia endosymbiont of Mansonella perstans TaxID=229526 RepID=UPI001CE179DE|nr:hypothetical protein [Wolbachia endosymbiont of Mansonella perstans]MCA4774360.1 hypothetical protein [Wolbachia endosymbiont of Mansonella perstans]